MLSFLGPADDGSSVADSWPCCLPICRQDTHSQDTSVQYSLITACKEYTSKYRKFYAIWLRRNDNNMSNETKRETNYSTRMT